MTVTAKRFINGSLMTAAAVTYYTAPTSTKAVIKALAICNTTGVAITVTIYLVPNGGTATGDNAITAGLSVAANATYTCPEAVNQVLEAGGMIQAKGANLSIVASGVEIT